MMNLASPVEPTIKELISHHSSNELQYLSPTMLNEFVNIKEEIAKEDFHSYTPSVNSIVFDPKCYGLMIWHSLLLFLVFLQGLYFPLLICFSIHPEKWTISTDFAISVFFLVDIAVKFNTAYFSNGFLVTERTRILTHYLKNWFFFDILVNFPYSWLMYQQIIYYNLEDTSEKKAAFCLEWIRLARFLKLKKMMNEIEFTLNSEWMPSWFKNTRIFSYVFFLTHWNACIWFFISSENLHPNSWIHNLNVSTKPDWVELYISSLYWSLTTLVTVGYGDISAGNIPEKITSIASMGIASALYGVIIGKITSSIIEKELEEGRYRNSAKNVDEFLKKPVIPLELRYRVRSYMNYLEETYSKNTVLDESVLEILSEPLRDEIAINIYAPIIIKSSTICLCFTTEIIMKMSKISKETSFAPEDIIFARHELVRKIYFIIEGGVRLYLTSEQDLTNSPANGVFGELGFFLGVSRTCNAKSSTFTTLMYLDYEELKVELERFPNALKSFERIKVLCRDDYEFLGIECFLCGRLGHVVIQCPDIDFSHERIEGKKRVSNRLTLNKNFEKAKKSSRKHFEKRFSKVGQTDYYVDKIREETPRLFETISCGRNEVDFRNLEINESIMDDILWDG